MAQADFFNYFSILIWFVIFFFFFYIINYIFIIPFVYSNLYTKSRYFYFLFNKIRNYEYVLILDKIYVYYIKKNLNIIYIAIKQYIYFCI